MTYEIYMSSSSDDQLSSRDLCSNIKNGGSNGSCSGYSTQVIQYNLLQSLETCFLGNRQLQPSLQASIHVLG